jgi:hypothetical protein
VVALIAVALIGLILFWTLGMDDPADTGARGASPTTSESAAPTSEQPEPSAEPTAEETTAEATTSAPADPLSAANVTEFLQSYHQQVLSDPRGAYARTGPTLRDAIGSEDAYVEYWSQFSDVVISDIQAVDGQTTATATLELRYPDGTSESGSHQFTFVVQDGQLILDSDFPA